MDAEDMQRKTHKPIRDLQRHDPTFTLLHRRLPVVLVGDSDQFQ